MKKTLTALIGALVLSAGLWSSTTTASALGACGPNHHRSPYGHCVWGGQNQAWCFRHKGHVAGGGVLGTRWCGA